MHLLPAGDSALLVELDGLAQTLELHRVLGAAPIGGVTDIVPAARTLLVQHEPAIIGRDALIDALCARAATALQNPCPATSGPLVEIPVHYDGEDLEEVAELLGITSQQVVELHTGHDYQAAFAGFSPGFVYLAGNPFGREIPRRKIPRVKVPAGSVAVAGGFSAIYPRESPGGWQLLGHTEVAMWDLARANPALVSPGFVVRFVDAATRTAPTRSTRAERPRTRQTAHPGGAEIEFLDVGLQTLVQDEGRTGKSQLGVSTSGALDRCAMHEANRMVGNPTAAPVLENTLGRLRLRCHGRATLAVTGAVVALTLHTADGSNWSVPQARPVALDDGDTLELGAVQRGMRCCLAVRGGWRVEPVLGSCATDTLSGLGPPAITRGTRLGAGGMIAVRELRAVQDASAPGRILPKAGGTVLLDIALGPRTDWFAAGAVDLLTQQVWQVSTQSDRVGMRLRGEQPLPRVRHDELQSEGTVAGAIQVPASGQPVLFLADHPLTGGYPVIGAVTRRQLDLTGQIPPGCSIRFRVVAPFSTRLCPHWENGA